MFNSNDSSDRLRYRATKNVFFSRSRPFRLLPVVIGGTLTSGFDFQHAVSYYCSVPKTHRFVLGAWGRQTDGRIVSSRIIPNTFGGHTHFNPATELIIQHAVEPSCAFEKLISEHAHQYNLTRIIQHLPRVDAAVGWSFTARSVLSHRDWRKTCRTVCTIPEPCRPTNTPSLRYYRKYCRLYVARSIAVAAGFPLSIHSRTTLYRGV